MGRKSLVAASGATETPQLQQVVTRKLGGQDVVAAASGTSGTVTLDASAANVFTLSPTGDVTALSITNVPNSVMCRLEMVVTQGGTARTVALPGGGHYHGPTPVQAANKDCIFVYETVDGGTTWHVWASQQA